MECYVFWKSVGLACDIVKEALKRLQRYCKVDAGHSIPLVISRPGRDLPARNYTRLILRDSEASYSTGLVLRGSVGSVLEESHWRLNLPPDFLQPPVSMNSAPLSRSNYINSP